MRDKASAPPLPDGRPGLYRRHAMPSPVSSKVQSVSEISRSIKLLLESGFAFVAVCGEVSNLKSAYSGHLYFTLKDRDAQLRAVLFKPQRRYLAHDITDGDKVICRGRISVYEARGDYQLLVDSVEEAGVGDRLAALERLKEQLRHEGLFDEARKRRLPLLPKGVALITSPQGAAVHDFLSIAGRRFPNLAIEIHPVPVQGPAAIPEIIRALDTACRRGRCDVIAICRGGGSAEDLWAFNDEALARAVAQTPLPVVSAIGHEVDFTLLDFVADQRAATPSAAAEIIVPDREQLRRRIGQFVLRQRAVFGHRLADYRHQLEVQRRLLGDPRRTVDGFRLRLDFLLNGLQGAMTRQLAARRQRLDAQVSSLDRQAPSRILTRHRESVARLGERLIELIQRQMERQGNLLRQGTSRLTAVSPQAALERGYAIVLTPEGKVVRSKREVAPGQRLGIRWYDGGVECVVTGDGSHRNRPEEGKNRG